MMPLPPMATDQPAEAWGELFEPSVELRQLGPVLHAKSYGGAAYPSAMAA
jgi:hypothetical protein